MKNKQTFTVITQSALSSDEWKVLGLLYQPVMGYLAFSMYHTFYHLLNQKNYQSQTFTKEFILELLNIKSDQFKEALEKLEALNLLNSFNHEDHFVFQLKTPLSPRGFIQDTVLGQFLKAEIGQKMYLALTELFKVEKFDLTNYVETTKTFDDIFNFVPSNHYSDTDVYLGKKNNLGAQIKKQIDFDQFIERLPDRCKKPILFWWKTEETIQKLVFIYQLTMDEIVDLYLKTVMPNGEIDLSNLSFKAQNLYQNKKQRLPVVSMQKELSGSEEQIKQLKEFSPMRIVEMYVKDDYQMMSSDTIMQLLERNQVEVGVINALLLHILKFKEGQLPHINYLEKVLETWIKNGVRTTEDAYHKVLSQATPEQKTKTQSKKNPEWVDNYLDELKALEESYNK